MRMDPCITNYLRSGVSKLRPGIELAVYKIGAFLYLKDFPEGYEFGVDYNSWTVEPKFLGLKMIPPGIHYIYVSVKGAPRIGFFHDFKSGEIVAKKWDAAKEDISEDIVSTDEVERFRRNLKLWDSRLDSYPFETYGTWFTLSDFITEETLKRLVRISAQSESVTMEAQLMENETLNATVGCSNTVDRDHPKRTRFVDQSGLPIMKIRPGYEIRFTEIPQLETGHRLLIDYTDRLNALLQHLNGDWKQLMAELQFAFTCFLIGQVFEGYEQWKKLITLLCCCRSSLKKYDEELQIFIGVLFLQIKECPTHFLFDIVSKDNFLTTSLAMMFANIRESEETSEQLKKNTFRFKFYLENRFKWSFETDW